MEFLCSKAREWLKTQEHNNPDEYWDGFVAYQMLFFLANSGMRPGELVKVKRKDIRFYKREGVPSHKALCALVQVHPSTKTGEREVNAMGGVFARRVWEQSSHKRRRTSSSAIWMDASSLRRTSGRSSTGDYLYA